MRVRALSEDGDMTWGNGGLNFYADCTEAVAQNVYTRLKLWLGEWQLDTGTGTDWAGECLGKTTLERASNEIRARILGTQGVTAIESLSITLDNRACSVTGELRTQYGKTTVNFAGGYHIGDSK